MLKREENRKKAKKQWPGSFVTAQLPAEMNGEEIAWITFAEKTNNSLVGTGNQVGKQDIQPDPNEYKSRETHDSIDEWLPGVHRADK